MRKILVLILCLLMAAPAFAQEDAPGQKDREAKVRKAIAERKISLSFQDTAVSEALAFLKDISRMVIVLDKESDTGQTVTLQLKDTTLESAFKIICEGAGLQYAVKGDVIHFATKERLAVILGGEEKKYTLKSGLKKGQKFTCKVSSMMGVGDNNEKQMKSDFEFRFRVAQVDNDGAARIKGTAEGKDSMGAGTEQQVHPFKKTPFEADITKGWGNRYVEGQLELFPGFEPAKGFLPEKPVKVGEKWEAGVSRVMAAFLLRFSAAVVPGGTEQSEDMKKMLLKAKLEMYEKMKVDATLTLSEMKGDIAVITGEIKELSFGEDAAPTVDPKKTSLRMEFDTKSGYLKLFDSKLRMTMPGGGYSMNLALRQELDFQEPPKAPEFAGEELADLVKKSDAVVAAEIVVFEKREDHCYYVVRVLSEIKGASGRQHIDVIVAKDMELDKGEKFILFLTETKEFKRTMFKLAGSEKAFVPYDAELLKKISETAKTGK